MIKMIFIIAAAITMNGAMALDFDQELAKQEATTVTLVDAIENENRSLIDEHRAIPQDMAGMSVSLIPRSRTKSRR